MTSLFRAAGLFALTTMWAISGCSQQEPGASKKAESNVAEATKGAAPSASSGAKANEHAQGDHDAHRHDGHQGAAHQSHGPHMHRDQGPAPKGTVKVGDKTPDFAVTMLDGRTVKLSDLQKQTKTGVVVLSFWCTTCHSCRNVEGALAQLQRDNEGQAAVFALAANANERAEMITAFFKRKGWDMPTALDPKAATADLFGTNKTTTTVVIDGQGILRYCGQFKQRSGGSAEEALKAVLAGKEVGVKTTPHEG